MSGLQITITTAGRAAIVNAENTGTAPLRIAQIGVTAQAFAPGAGMTALPAELKRLSTFAGAVVADDTVHVTIRDDSEDVYGLRGFALYLADGTLFALYGQADVILEKSAQAMLLLAADIRFVEVSATSLTFGDTNWINPPATTTVQGVVELADNGEAITGADGTRAMTPVGTKAVLDDRFGANAPSAFVKTLLALATASAIRLSLGLGNASLRNEGAGNGLDSDLLDGQHGSYYRQWANLQGVPATFTPSGHGHAWGDLSGVPATATRWPSFAEVTDKPPTYPPSGHTHAAADITSGELNDARIPSLSIGKIINLQTSLNAKAPLNAPTFTTSITMHAGPARWNDPNGVLTVEIGAGYSNATDGNAFIANRTANGFIELFAMNGGSRLRVGPGGASWNDNGLWHAGNFTPASKLDYRGNLEATAATIGDWNAAVFTGWYRSPPGTPNAPEAGKWYFGTVIRHDDNWMEQVVRQFSGDPNVEFFRIKFAGAWSAWQRRYTNQDALDSRYAQIGANTVFGDLTAHRGDGSGVIFLNATKDRYLHYTGTRYELNGAALHVHGAISTAAGISAAGTIVGSTLQASSSDARLKQEIEDLGDCLAIVKRLRPRRWKWIESGEQDFGWIAQEHREVIPGAVHEDEDGMLFVRYGKAEALIVGALQQIDAKLEALGDRVAAIEAR